MFLPPFHFSQLRLQVLPVPALPAPLRRQGDAFEAVSRRTGVGDRGADATSRVRLRDGGYRHRQQHRRNESEQYPHQLSLAVAITVRPLP